MSKQKPQPTKFKVGDWVSYPFSPTPGLAKVIEVRGPLAPGGEQVYRLRMVEVWGEVREFERRESMLQLAEPPEREPTARPPEEWGRWTG
jgi:hypothetical protein